MGQIMDKEIKVRKIPLQHSQKSSDTGSIQSLIFIRMYSTGPLKNGCPNATIPRFSYHPALVVLASHHATVALNSERASEKT